jgi:PPK2 family polyphosphate:nucleotide phosphotransferase
LKDQTELDRLRVQTGGPAGLAERRTDWLPEAARDQSEKQIKKRAKRALGVARDEVIELQRRFYADDRRALLVVFQAMDAGGKDGTIRHVMSGVNPQGCQVHSFKVPSAEELAHDYLWRYSRALPERGRIGIFNRSHYEEVLVLRVHPDLLTRQRNGLVSPDPEFWAGRLAEIAGWESQLAASGTHIVKFFLHLGKAEQRARFLSRLDDPAKNWKFEAGDLAERDHWDDYQQAYEQALTATSAAHAPWYVIPADRKEVMRSLVGQILAKELNQLDPQYPRVSAAKRAELEQYRTALEASGRSK